MLNGRKRSTALTALCIAALGSTVFSAGPSAAEPTLPEVEAKVEKLYHEAEVAAERYNDIRVELQQGRVQLRSLRADLARQQDKVDALRDEVAATVLSQAQGQTFSATAELVLSEDPEAFLDQLATVQAYNSQRAEILAGIAVQYQRLAMREEATQSQVKAIADAEAQLAEEKAEIDEKAAAAEALLDRLEAEERARLSLEHREERPSRSDSRESIQPAGNVPVSGRAATAVEYARAQVSDAYVYGASGPDAFDCSGLTMRAWGAAGVSLPHSSSGQMAYGTPVSASDLQPGDLVFYYNPVSHVGIYIGNGQIVDAANPSTGVRVAGVFSMPFTAARRLG